MRLNYLKLHQIGPYEWVKFDLNTTKDKNVILICGDNGAGKTTLLKCFKYGLFGSFIFGYKQLSKSNPYKESIKDLISNGKNGGSIILAFTIVKDYVENEYVLTRKYELEPKFKETVYIEKNGKSLSNKEIIDMQEFLNNYFSPKLVDSIMFDGEHIINLIDDDLLSNYLQEEIENTHELSNYKTLTKDLEKYINTSFNKKDLTVEQLELNKFEFEYKKAITSSKNLTLHINELVKTLSVIESSYESKLSDFSKIGGIDNLGFDKLKELLRNQEKFRSVNSALFRKMCENELLLYLNRDLLNNAYNISLVSKPKRYSKYLNEILDSGLDFSQEIIYNIRNTMDFINSRISDSFLLELTPYQEEKLSKYTSTDFEFIKEGIVSKLNSNLDTSNALIELRKKLSINENDQVKELLNDIEKTSANINNLISEINEKKNELVGIDNNVSDLKSKMELAKIRVFDKQKSNDSYVLALKYLDTCRQSYSTILAKSLKDIGELATKIVVESFRKNNFIDKIDISNDFEVSIFMNGEKRNINQLSAGEKQMFVTSLIVSIIRLSNRKLPMIFDTPCSRLDNSHKNSFYKNIMVKSGFQVIIMPTSNEINYEIVENISDKIKKVYTLNYTESGKTIVMEDSLFGENIVYDK